MNFDTKLIAERIKEVAIRENKFAESVAHDVAFHMTDWLEELARYNEFCKHPRKLTNKQVEKLLLAFLTHVPNHVAAASKLYTDIPVTDVFGAGSTAESGDK